MHGPNFNDRICGCITAFLPTQKTQKTKEFTIPVEKPIHGKNNQMLSEKAPDG